MTGQLSSSRAVVRSGVANIVAFTVSSLYMFLLVPIIVAHIGLEQYGLWSIIVAVTGTIGLLDAGFYTALVPYLARALATDDVRGVTKVLQHGLLFYSLVSVAVLVAGTLLATPLFHLLEIPPVQWDTARRALTVGLFGFFVSSTAAVLSSIPGAMQRMEQYTILNSLLMIAKFGLILLLLHQGGGVVSLMLADVVTNGLLAIGLAFIARRLLPGLTYRWLGYDGPLMGTLFRFGLKLQVARIGEVVQAQFDKFLISRYVGLNAVSMYDFGARPTGRLRVFVLTGVTALLPAVSALDAVENTARIRAALLRSTRYVALVAAPLFIFAIAFAEPLIQVWLGPERDQAATVMQILSSGLLLGVLMSPMAIMAQGQGEPQHQMKSTLLQAAANVVLSSTLLYLYGFFGAVVGTTVATTLGMLVFLRLYGPHVDPHPFRLLLSLVSKPLLVSLALGAGGLALVRAADFPDGRLNLAFVLLLCFVGFLGLYALLILGSKYLNKDDWGFVRGVMQRKES